jgi:hypothetical protein
MELPLPLRLHAISALSRGKSPPKGDMSSVVELSCDRHENRKLVLPTSDAVHVEINTDRKPVVRRLIRQDLDAPHAIDAVQRRILSLHDFVVVRDRGLTDDFQFQKMPEPRGGSKCVEIPNGCSPSEASAILR